MINFTIKNHRQSSLQVLASILQQRPLKQSVNEREGVTFNKLDSKIGDSTLLFCQNLINQNNIRQAYKNMEKLYQDKIHNEKISIYQVIEIYWQHTLICEMSKRSGVILCTNEEIHEQYRFRLTEQKKISSSRAKYQDASIFMTQIIQTYTYLQEFMLLGKLKSTFQEYRYLSDFPIQNDLEQEKTIEYMVIEQFHLIHQYEREKKIIHDLNLQTDDIILQLYKLFRIHLLQKQFPDHQVNIKEF